MNEDCFPFIRIVVGVTSAISIGIILAQIGFIDKEKHLPYYAYYLPTTRMRLEKLLLAFFAILGGLLVAGAAFYFYQSTKTISPSQVKTVRINAPTPTSVPVLLTLDSPQDTSVTNNKTVTVSGKTDPGATVVISTDSNDQVVTPASTGSFSTTVTIDNGENTIHVLAIGPNGQEMQKIVTVTYSTEDF